MDHVTRKDVVSNDGLYSFSFSVKPLANTGPQKEGW